MLYTAWGTIEEFEDQHENILGKYKDVISLFEKDRSEKGNEKDKDKKKKGKDNKNELLQKNIFDFQIQGFYDKYEKERKPDNANRFIFNESYPTDYKEIDTLMENMDQLLPNVPDISHKKLSKTEKKIVDEVVDTITESFKSFIDNLYKWISTLVSVIMVLVQKNIDFTVQKYHRIDPPKEYIEKIYKMSDLLYIYGLDGKFTLQSTTLSVADPPLPPKDLKLYLSMINRARLSLIEFENYPTMDNFIPLTKHLGLIVQTLNTLPEELQLKMVIDAFTKFKSDKNIKSAIVPPLNLDIYKKPRIT